MAGYPVINPAGADILNVDGTTTHYNNGEVVPLSKLISRRYSWLVERGYLSEDFAEVFDTSTVNGDLTVTGGLFTEYIAFNTSSPYHTVLPGELSWNNDEGTLDLGLQGGNVTLSLGQEEVVRIKNNTGSPLTDGQIVYVTGSIGSGSNYRITVALAQANAEATSSKTFGVVTETIANGSEGFVCTFGLVRGINTASFNEGDSLYLSPTTAGQLTNVKPSAPNHMVFIGWVIRKNSTEGTVFVHPQNGYELDELHDVGITSKADNDILSYDSTLGYWKNQNLAAAVNEVGSSINSLSNYLPLTGGTLTGDLTIDKSLPRLTLNTTLPETRYIKWQTANNVRWVAGVGSQIESGSNAGSDFQILRYTDAGGFIDSPLTIIRQTGWAYFSNNITAASNISTTSGTFSAINNANAKVRVGRTNGANAPTTIATGAYLELGNAEWNTNSYRLISFGWRGSGSNFPAYIGFQEKDTNSYTKGDLIFGTRDVTTDTEPVERMRIAASGLTTLSGDLTISKASPLLKVYGVGTGATISIDADSNSVENSLVFRNGGTTRVSLGLATSSSDFIFNSTSTGGRNAGFQFINGATTLLTLANTGAVTLNGTLTNQSTTDSTSRLTGSITTEGGIGAQKHITAAYGFAVESTQKPTAPTVALAGVPGNVDNGTHWYFVTYVTANGETELSQTNSVTVADKTVNGQVNVTIPVSADPRVTGRKIYRNTNNGISYVQVYHLATINDNTTTLYVDNIADASMTPPPSGAGTSYYYKDNTTVQLLKDVTGNKILAYASSLNTGFGYGTLASTVAGTSVGGYNVGFGTNVMPGLTTGVQNTAIGNGAGGSLSAGNDNVFAGQSAGYAVTTGGANIMIGRNTGGANKTGGSNTYIGYYSAYGAGATNQNGGSNTGVGASSLYSMTSGLYNVAVGTNSIYSITSGMFNTAAGHWALGSVSGGTNNVALGAYAGRWETGSNNFYVNNLDRGSLANDRAQSLLYGTFHATASSQQLTINGDVNMTYNAAVNGSLTLSSSQHYIKNGTPTTLNFVKGSMFGYSSGYRAIVLGDTATSPNNVTVAIGYDPAVNSNGSFSGNGSEIILRNSASFITPNATNDGWYKTLRFDSSGKTTIGDTVLANVSQDNTLYLYGNNNTEAYGTFDDAKPFYGITFRRAWNGSGITNISGIYAWGSGGYRGGLVFKTNNNGTSGTQPTTTALSLEPDGDARFGADTDSTSTSTGSITTLGGMGIAKSLYVGGKLTLRDSAGTENMFMSKGYSILGLVTIGRSGTGYGTVGDGYRTSVSSNTYTYDRDDYATMIDFSSGGFAFKTAPGGAAGNTITYTSRLAITNTGAITTSSTFAQSNTTDASSTTTGALTTAGGLGVAKSLYVGTGITSFSNGTTWALSLGNTGSDGGANGWYVSPTGSAWAAGDNKLAFSYSGSSANSLLTIVGPTGLTGIGNGNYNPSATLDVKSYLTTDIGLIVRGVLSQTANLQEWRNSTGTILASVSPSGAFTAVTKSFDIEHPTKEGKRLRYGSLEGPENGVYVRGKNDSHVITLPDYWTGLVDPDSITVQLTSNGKFQPLYVEEIKDNSVIVGGVEAEYFYFIQAERIDVDKLVVEYGS